MLVNNSASRTRSDCGCSGVARHDWTCKLLTTLEREGYDRKASEARQAVASSSLNSGTASEAVSCVHELAAKQWGRDGLPCPQDQTRRIFDAILFLNLVSTKTSVPFFLMSTWDTNVVIYDTCYIPHIVTPHEDCTHS